MSCIYPHQPLFYPEPRMCSQTAMNSCGKRQIMVSLHLCKRIWKIQIYSDQQQNMLLIPVVQLQNALCPPSAPTSTKFYFTALREYFGGNHHHKETMTYSKIKAHCFFISTYSRPDNVKQLKRSISFQWKSSHVEKF